MLQYCINSLCSPKKDDHILQLLAQHEDDMLTICAMLLVMDDFMAKQKELVSFYTQLGK